MAGRLADRARRAGAALRGTRLWGMLTVGRLAALTDSPRRFLARQRHPPASACAYRLRGTSTTVHVRHGTPDVNTLYEVLLAGEYEPPPAAAQVLDDLPERPLVLDLGANVGLFGIWMRRRRPRARIVSLEPDPANADVLARTIAANGAQDDWRLVRACAASADGEVRFAAGAYSVSRIADEGDDGAIVVPSVDVLRGEFALADVIKLDIEGGEWPILDDPRFADLAARVAVVEYHPHGAGGRDPERAARAALQAAGMSVQRTRVAPQWGSGVLWGWR